LKSYFELDLKARELKGKMEEEVNLEAKKKEWLKKQSWEWNLKRI